MLSMKKEAEHKAYSTRAMFAVLEEFGSISAIPARIRKALIIEKGPLGTTIMKGCLPREEISQALVREIDALIEKHGDAIAKKMEREKRRRSFTAFNAIAGFDSDFLDFLDGGRERIDLKRIRQLDDGGGEL